MSFAENLANVVNRYDEISSLLSAPGLSADEMIKMNKELSELEPVVTAIHAYQKAEKNMKEAESLMYDDSVDKEMQVANDSNTIHNVYTGDVEITAQTHNSVANSAFKLTIKKLPKSACTYMMSADWGSTVGSGWISIKANNGTEYKVGAATNPAPASVANAASACTSESDNTVDMIFQ